jgi:hypothetical protein
MTTAPAQSVREVLLRVIEAHDRKRKDYSPGTKKLVQGDVLNETQKVLGITHGDDMREQAVLTAWNDLLRTGVIAWGASLHSPSPPHFFVTDVGRRALEQITRDPHNPTGYMRHLDTRAKVDSVTRSYISEAVECYAAGFFKSSGVMVGAAAESIIVDLIELVKSKLATDEQPVPNDLNDWRIMTATKALTDIFDARIQKKKPHRELRERYDAQWKSFAGHFEQRATTRAIRQALSRSRTIWCTRLCSSFQNSQDWRVRWSIGCAMNQRGDRSTIAPDESRDDAAAGTREQASRKERCALHSC